MHGNGINNDKTCEDSPKFIESSEFLDGILAGVYQVDNDGNFVYCNQEAAHILEYESKQELMKKNIYDLYFDPNERDILMERMRKNNGTLKTEGLRWKRKNGLEVVINDFAEFAYDENGNERGVGGIFIDATYQKLFDDLNAGVYKIGPDEKTIQFVNKAVARMFGFSSPEEMEGKDISTFYKNYDEYKTFIEYLKKNGETKNFPLNMRKVNGEPITISVSCHLLKDEDGIIIGREGTFTDITEQSKFEQLLEQPLGVYEARLEDGKPIIYYCNETFAKMFGYRTKEEVRGIDIHDFYVNEKDVYRFEKALIEADKKDKPLAEYLLKVKRKTYEKDKKEEYFWIEIFCLMIKDEKGNIIGRKGTIMDVSDRFELASVIRKREGIQKFIHGLIAPVISINSTCQILSKEIERKANLKYKTDYVNKIFERKFNVFILYNKITDISVGLSEKMYDLIAILKNENKFSRRKLMELNRNADLLRKETKDIARRIIEVRELQKKIYNSLFQIYSTARSSRNVEDSRRITDIIRNCFVDLHELDNLYLLYLGQTIQCKSTVAYHDIEGLRQLMMRFGEKSEEEQLEFERINVTDILQDIIGLYQIDAFLKGIKINEPDKRNIEVVAAREKIERMLSYIIQNAVKYSFKRDGYIKVDIQESEKEIRIDIEDYGVGITSEEINSGKIFEYGYRGKFSWDRNRTGSGIGLAESKRIVEAHGGKILLKSIPVGSTSVITQNTPHKTIVSIIIPTNQKKGR
jgi:PAS domain S-box-containing protein